ncbi:hypothetical protein F4810DRAFT_156063 [Camillea tinctor]|nr:hypothetical protein F4810DRAFT_156063 [Camillea tinctor]
MDHEHSQRSSHDYDGQSSLDYDGFDELFHLGRVGGLSGTSQWSSLPPSRCDFKVGIVCALPLEASVVSILFDRQWDSNIVGKETGDPNAYSIGMIGQHNVVLTHMPNMGKVAAAMAATWLSASFQGIKLALVVGICGGVPSAGGAEIILGDVVISEGIIQYDLGRRFPNNNFLRKDTPRDNLPRPNLEIRAALAKVKTQQGRNSLQDKLSGFLDILVGELRGAEIYPGMAKDKLFKSKYLHKHHELSGCVVCSSKDGGNNVCDEAFESSCERLECDDQEVVPRSRLTQHSGPAIHFGLIASGDVVMRSGEDRDIIASRDGVIAFEMEGAGVWEMFPSSLVIKGVCDYADSHKNKVWQNYAAATAAAATKAFLEIVDIDSLRQPRSHQYASHHRRSSRRSMAMRPNQEWKVEEVKFLNKLRKSPYQDRKDLNPDRVQGTCEWFVQHKLFQEWQDGNSRILWVSADPGCGKSVLAKYLVDSILPAKKSRTICYFFFKDGFEDQKTITGALCCLLHQLFKQKRALCSEAIIGQLSDDKGGFTNSFSDLWEALLDAAENNDAAETICVLDAIDECELRGMSQLSQALCRFSSLSRKSKLKFLLTSRPYDRIRRDFHLSDIPDLAVVHLAGESDEETTKISREIDVFIKARVQGIGARLMLRQDDQELLLQALMCVQHRTYLWVHLTLDLIESDPDIDKNGIIKATSHIPQTVDEAYDRILSTSRDFEQARKILHIIVAAARPLTLREMGFVMALREEHTSHSEVIYQSEDRLRVNIRDICGLFVVIIDSRIYLLHQTAREFLVKSGQQNSPASVSSSLKWKHLIQPQEAHKILAEICIWYLLLTEFENQREEAENISQQDMNRYRLLDYSANHWSMHFRESRIAFIESKLQSALRICDIRSARCSIWLRVFWKSQSTDFPLRFTTLMIASYFGLEAVVKHLLRTENFDLDECDMTHGRSALSWAAENNHDVIVRLLTSSIYRMHVGAFKLAGWKGANVNSLDKYRRTPLSYAAWKGNISVVKLLLKAGGLIDSRDGIGFTLWIYDICNEHKDVLQLLIENGQGGERNGGIDSYLIFSAIQRGDAAVVQPLLDIGKVDMNAKSHDNRKLLHNAALFGNESIVRLLLHTGKVALNTRNPWRKTPLHSAVVSGNDTIIRMLLDTGRVDLNIKDRWGQTPLLIAFKQSPEKAVQLLAAMGINRRNTKGQSRWQPLWDAFEREDEDFIREFKI